LKQTNLDDVFPTGFHICCPPGSSLKDVSTHKTVYVAGPYSHGDVAVNVREAIQAADRLLIYGFYPYVPHLTHFWHLVFPRPYQEWLELDKVWLKKCDAVLLLPGKSPGAEKEVDLAKEYNIPVFESIGELLEWRDDDQD